MSPGVVTEHVWNLIARQVGDHWLVVWYDPEQAYATAAESLALPIPPLLNDEQTMYFKCNRITNFRSVRITA